MKKRLSFLIATIWALLCIASVVLLNTSQIFLPNPQGRWTLTHILNSHLQQSHKIQEYLLNRKALSSFDELVVLLEKDDDLKQRLEKSGFVVSYKDPEEFYRNFPDLAPPAFLLTSPRGQGVYAGGYGDKVQDVAIAQSYFSNKILSSFPISGCGSSMKAQRFLILRL